MNYDLHNQEQINFTEKVNERIKSLNLKRAVRHDAVVMCQCLITSGHEFFEGMSKAEQDKFFQDSYNFVCHRYGQRNIISATVHYDERTPHLHVNFVPVTSDGRLCAKELFKRKDLSILHDDFYKFNKARGYDLERGENKGQLQEHLDTEEFKLKKRQEFLYEDKKELSQAEAELKKKQRAIESVTQASDNVLNKLGHFNTIQTKKSLVGGKISLTGDDYSKLLAFAKEGLTLRDERERGNLLQKEIEKLCGENDKLKKKAEISVSERLNHGKQVSAAENKYYSLVNKYNDLVGRINEITDFLGENNLMNDFKEYQLEQERQKENSHDWGMEL